MKRIIFNIFGDVKVPHQSAPETKQEKFRKHKDELIHRQKQYAINCNADFESFSTDNIDYNLIQFEKIRKIEELSSYYDEILYLDLDVIPNTNLNFFEVHDLNKISCTAFTRQEMDSTREKKKKFVKAMNEGWLDPMNLYVKGALKISMLLLDNKMSTNSVINTGVVGANKRSIEKLDFTNNIHTMKQTFMHACEDNVYPEEISSLFQINNEVFFTYLLEKNEIEWNDITLAWNFILDSQIKTFSPACHFIHQVNKEFESTFDAIQTK